MKCSILEVSLLLVVLNPGTAEDGDQKDDPNLVFSNGSSPVLLPCSRRSHTRIKAIQWMFKPASGNNVERICIIDDITPQCNSPRFPHVILAETDGFRTGSYSLLFTATMEDAGIYTCSLYPQHQTNGIEIRLIVINVSVTPAGPIPLGTSVNLTCEMSDPSYFNRIDWSIQNTQITAKGNLIQWKLNNGLILKDKRHTLNFRTLNISNFKLHDAGLYTYTVRLNNGKFCSYSRLLEISDPLQNSNRNIVIGGAAVGVAVVVLAMILIGLLIKSKYKSADQNSAPVQNNEDNYATINLDTLGKPGKGVKRSAEAASIYTEVQNNEDNYATINLDALGKAGEGVKRSAEAATVYAEVQNNEDNYAAINLDALGKAGKGVKRSAEAATVYAEVNTNSSDVVMD